MENRYEKLDAFLDSAFRGSPNTLEANETKIEIATNLRLMYDELLQSGLSEEEALSRTCDSLGNPEEIFGKGTSSAARGNPESSAPRGFEQDTFYTLSPDTPSKKRVKPPHSPLHSLFVTIGVLLCALCWVPTAMAAVAGIESSWIAAPVLLSVSLGVLCFIYSASLRIGASSKTHLHYLLIGLGVACEISCAVPVIITEGGTVGLVALFALIALGVILIVSGAMIPTDPWDDSEEEEPKKESPLEKSVMLFTTAIYLIVSFATGAWAVTWIIFVIGAFVKNLVRAILDLCRNKDNNRGL